MKLSRSLAPTGFVILHVIGGMYALDTLRDAWTYRLLVRLLVERTLVFKLLHLPWIVIPVAIALVVVLATVETGRTVARWRQGRPEPDLGVRLRGLACIALLCVAVNAFMLSTPLSFSGPFRVKFPINAQISLAFAYGSYALWSLLLPRLRRVVPGRLRRGLDLLGTNVAATLVLGEISLRALAVFWSSPLLVTASTPSQIRRDSDRQPPGYLHYGFPMNRGGHYDTEFVPSAAPLERIVASIGDSYSYGAVHHAYHFTTVAERELPGVEFYNMGYPGTGPSDYLHLLQHEALPLAPELVVIQLFMGNDVHINPELGGPTRWYDGDRYLLAIVWYRLRMMRRAELVNLNRGARATRTAGDDLTATYPWLNDPLHEPPHLAREVFLQLETQNAQGICVPNDGVYQQFFQSLATLKQAAGQVSLAFVLIPDEFQVEDDLWQEVVRRSDQPLDRDLAQRKVVEWLEARGWPVLDLLPLLRAVEPMADGRRHLYHLQDTHFNARGNEIAGRALARFVHSLQSTGAASAERRASRPAIPPPPTVSLPFHLDVGDSTARRWMESGWHGDEVAGGQTLAWSDGVRSVLTVPLPEGRDVRMDFEALPFVFARRPQQRVTIVLNGTVVEHVKLRRGLQKYSVTLPAEALREPLDTLEFRYAYARVPREVLRDSPDIRVLAVAWYSIDFAERNR